MRLDIVADCEKGTRSHPKENFKCYKGFDGMEGWGKRKKKNSVEALFEGIKEISTYRRDGTFQELLLLRVRSPDEGVLRGCICKVR